jgi:hypothetical protein
LPKIIGKTATREVLILTSTWKLLLVALLGATIGFVILFWGFWGWSDKHSDFAGTSPFVLWAALICAQTALWVLVLAWLAPSLARLVRSADRGSLGGHGAGGHGAGGHGQGYRPWSEFLLSTFAVVVSVGLFVGFSLAVKTFSNQADQDG